MLNVLIMTKIGQQSAHATKHKSQVLLKHSFRKITNYHINKWRSSRRRLSVAKIVETSDGRLIDAFSVCRGAARAGRAESNALNALLGFNRFDNT